MTIRLLRNNFVVCKRFSSNAKQVGRAKEINTLYLEHLDSLENENLIFDKNPEAVISKNDKIFKKYYPRGHTHSLTIQDAQKYNIPVGTERTRIKPSKHGVIAQYTDPINRVLLYRATGFDLSKILKVHKKRDFMVRIRLLSEDQIASKQITAIKKAVALMNAPPPMHTKEEIVQILETNPEIAGHETTNLMFVDIAPKAVNMYANKPNKTEPTRRNQWVTVRQPDGTLRLATWAERQRGLKVFYMEAREEFRAFRKIFPSPSHLDPFHEAHESACRLGRYNTVLTHGCLQFELDSVDWANLKHKTFTNAINNKHVGHLYSTRFFGNFLIWLCNEDYKFKSYLDDSSLKGQIEQTPNTQDLYKFGVLQTLQGKNCTDDSVASFEEIKTSLTAIIKLNPEKFKQEFGSTLGLEKEFGELVDYIADIDIEDLPDECDPEVFRSGAKVGMKNDSCVEYGFNDSKFNKLNIIKDDKTIQKVLTHLVIDQINYLKSESLIWLKEINFDIIDLAQTLVTSIENTEALKEDKYHMGIKDAAPENETEEKITNALKKLF